MTSIGSPRIAPARSYSLTPQGAVELAARNRRSVPDAPEYGTQTRDEILPPYGIEDAVRGLPVHVIDQIDPLPCPFVNLLHVSLCPFCGASIFSLPPPTGPRSTVRNP